MKKCKVCKRCRYKRYCSEECHRKGWKEHSKECGVMTGKKVKELSGVVLRWLDVDLEIYRDVNKVKVGEMLVVYVQREVLLKSGETEMKGIIQGSRSRIVGKSDVIPRLGIIEEKEVRKLYKHRWVCVVGVIEEFKETSEVYAYVVKVYTAKEMRTAMQVLHALEHDSK